MTICYRHIIIPFFYLSQNNNKKSTSRFLRERFSSHPARGSRATRDTSLAAITNPTGVLLSHPHTVGKVEAAGPHPRRDVDLRRSRKSRPRYTSGASHRKGLGARKWRPARLSRPWWSGGGRGRPCSTGRRRCLSWCTKKWTLHRASPPPPPPSRTSVSLSRRAASACTRTGLRDTNPPENVHRLPRLLEIGLNPRSGWRHDAGKRRDYFFLLGRRPLRTTFRGTGRGRNARLSACTKLSSRTDWRNARRFCTGPSP